MTMTSFNEATALSRGSLLESFKDGTWHKLLQ